MITLETKKINLISQIITFNNEQIISELEHIINAISLQSHYSKLFKPVKADLFISEMIKDQNYNGVNRQKFESIITDLDIQEPISELLSI